jgi:thiamine-phosphate pyrophosphorylase
MKLPRVYPITDRSLSNLSHTEQVKRLIAGGAKLIQLREKRAAANVFYDDALAALAYARERGVQIIINDRADIAMVLNADGVHVGQCDLPPDAARRVLGEKAIIGFSTHSLAQALEAIRMPIDYLAIGPVFATSTKENPDPEVGLEGVRRVREATRDFQLIAIGGITRDNAAAVFDAGADSIAVASAVLSEPGSISEAMEELIQLAESVC